MAGVDSFVVCPDVVDKRFHWTCLVNVAETVGQVGEGHPGGTGRVFPAGGSTHRGRGECLIGGKLPSVWCTVTQETDRRLFLL